jgi:ferredoxin
MANLTKRVPEDVPGDFFVDTTCIDCDTCRQLAPDVFGEAPGHAFVRRQPTTAEGRRQALRALVCCPTGSIGSLGADRPQAVLGDFPLPLEEPVFYCGFNSPKSYGGNSYFVRHPGGNWLIDSPKFLPRLVNRLEALGGVAHIFLTHSDDVADARLYAERFGGKRVIHRAELSAQPDAEVVLDGEEPVELAPDFLAIPTPGHTKGHCVLLFRRRFLFTGDHLAWDRHEKQLEAYHDYCWYS